MNRFAQSGPSHGEFLFFASEVTEELYGLSLAGTPYVPP